MSLYSIASRPMGYRTAWHRAFGEAQLLNSWQQEAERERKEREWAWFICQNLALVTYFLQVLPLSSTLSYPLFEQIPYNPINLQNYTSVHSCTRRRPTLQYMSPWDYIYSNHNMDLQFCWTQQHFVLNWAKYANN
jgi:hypothetical protein